MRLAETPTWQRARAILLNEHFTAATIRIDGGYGKLTGNDGEIFGMWQLLNGRIIQEEKRLNGRLVQEERRLNTSPKSLLRAYYQWRDGGRTAEALLLDYKAGCGGKTQLPRELVMELQRRCTLPLGGRDKDGKAPVSVIIKGLKRDFAQRRPLPGIDYDQFAPGAEFPWSDRTLLRHKPGRQMRALGNVGIAAHKNASAYVSMDYSRLRKCELYTLDDVRLDILCVDQATGRVIEVRLYVMMEVASRCVVAYILKPLNHIKEEDVDELVAYSLQTPGFGIGIGYTTHIFFERGTVSCSKAAAMALEGITQGRIKIHWTSMIKGVRWIGAAADKARGNAAGKGVIESFNRRLHHALMHLPGQRGNNYDNAPASLGYDGADNFSKGSLAAETQALAQFQITANAANAGGEQRIRLKLGMLYLRQLDQAVRDAIKAHNGESGHAYRSHGTHFEAEVEPGVWKRVEEEPAPIALPPARNVHFDDEQEAAAPEPGKKQYKLATAAPQLTPKQRNGMYWAAWKKCMSGTGCAETMRFSLTRGAIGHVMKPQAMTDEQIKKVIAAFENYLRANKAGVVGAPQSTADNEPF